MGLIGQTWKHRKVWSLLVLIDQNKHTRHYRAQTKKHTHVFASTMQYLTQHRNTRAQKFCCPESLSVVNSDRETPGPIPNPEAKPARADGTATGRLWESKLPPT